MPHKVTDKVTDTADNMADDARQPEKPKAGTMTYKRMAFRVRSSKFRHVYGSPGKKEVCYECIKITKNAHDSTFCAVNPRFLAVVTESGGGGTFIVLPIEKVGRVDINAPRVCGHSGPVLDIKWNPFNDHVIASASDDATVKVWQVPEGGLRGNLSDWLVDLHGHQRRVGFVEWHPTADGLLLSAGYDFKCILWNVHAAEPVNVIDCHVDTIFSISWNRDGSLFATTSKDKVIRVVDPRSGSVLAEGLGHQGPKASKVVFLGDRNRLFTTGFSKTSDRQYGIWDIGDGNIRYYEISDDSPYCHYLAQYQSSSPQKGLGYMPKRGIDVTRCEIMRFYKLHTTKAFVEPVAMIVPRKSEMFQEDIYPPTASCTPSLTADEWVSGQNRDPILVSLKSGDAVTVPRITTAKAVQRKPSVEKNRTARGTINACDWAATTVTSRLQRSSSTSSNKSEKGVTSSATRAGQSARACAQGARSASQQSPRTSLRAKSAAHAQPGRAVRVATSTSHVAKLSRKFSKKDGALTSAPTITTYRTGSSGQTASSVSTSTSDTRGQSRHGTGAPAQSGGTGQSGAPVPGSVRNIQKLSSQHEDQDDRKSAVSHRISSFEAHDDTSRTASDVTSRDRTSRPWNSNRLSNSHDASVMNGAPGNDAELSSTSFNSDSRHSLLHHHGNQPSPLSNKTLSPTDAHVISQLTSTGSPRRSPQAAQPADDVTRSPRSQYSTYVASQNIINKIHSMTQSDHLSPVTSPDSSVTSSRPQPPPSPRAARTDTSSTHVVQSRPFPGPHNDGRLGNQQAKLSESVDSPDVFKTPAAGRSRQSFLSEASDGSELFTTPPTSPAIYQRASESVIETPSPFSRDAPRPDWTANPLYRDSGGPDVTQRGHGRRGRGRAGAPADDVTGMRGSRSVHNISTETKADVTSQPPEAPIRSSSFNRRPPTHGGPRGGSMRERKYSDPETRMDKYDFNRNESARKNFNRRPTMIAINTGNGSPEPEVEQKPEEPPTAMIGNISVETSDVNLLKPSTLRESLKRDKRKRDEILQRLQRLRQGVAAHTGELPKPAGEGDRLPEQPSPERPAQPELVNATSMYEDFNDATQDGDVMMKPSRLRESFKNKRRGREPRRPPSPAALSPEEDQERPKVTLAGHTVDIERHQVDTSPQVSPQRYTSSLTVRNGHHVGSEHKVNLGEHRDLTPRSRDEGTTKVGSTRHSAFSPVKPQRSTLPTASDVTTPIVTYDAPRTITIVEKGQEVKTSPVEISPRVTYRGPGASPRGPLSPAGPVSPMGMRADQSPVRAQDVCDGQEDQPSGLKLSRSARASFNERFGQTPRDGTQRFDRASPRRHTSGAGSRAPPAQQTRDRNRRITTDGATPASPTAGHRGRVHVRKVWTAQVGPAVPHLSNGSEPQTDPELRKAYFRQVEELKALKEQIALKDKRIRQLEAEVGHLRELDSVIGESNC